MTLSSNWIDILLRFRICETPLKEGLRPDKVPSPRGGIEDGGNVDRKRKCVGKGSQVFPMDFISNNQDLRNLSMLLCNLCCLLLMLAVPDGLRTGDLVFVSDSGSVFSSAISDATSDGVHSFVHVGIVEVCDDGIFIIEAEPECGVRRIALAEFAIGQNLCFMRLKMSFHAEAAVARAKSKIGEAYDWYYLPDNGMSYCSELVYDCYLDGEGRHIFTASPMSFRNASGEIPEFWTELFERLGCPVPEGIEGTNPNSMAESGLLEVIQAVS